MHPARSGVQNRLNCGEVKRSVIRRSHSDITTAVKSFSDEYRGNSTATSRDTGETFKRPSAPFKNSAKLLRPATVRYYNLSKINPLKLGVAQIVHKFIPFIFYR